MSDAYEFWLNRSRWWKRYAMYRGRTHNTRSFSFQRSWKLLVEAEKTRLKEEEA